MPDVTVSVRGARGPGLAEIARGSGVAPPDATDAEAIVAVGKAAMDELIQDGNTDLALVTAFAKTVLDDTTAKAARATLGAGVAEAVLTVDHGAVGNGVANDTAALLAAIATGARKIIIPVGTFLVDAFEWGAGQEIVGVDRYASILKLRSATTTSFLVAVDAPDCAVRNLTLDCNDLITYGSVVAGIRCDGIAVERVTAINTERFGVAINSSDRVVVRNNELYMPQLLSFRVTSVTAGSGGTPNQIGLHATVSGGSPTVAETILYDTTSGGAVTNVRYAVQGGSGKGYSVAAGVPTVTFPAVPSASCTVALAGTKVIAINGPDSFGIGKDWIVEDNYCFGGCIDGAWIGAKVHRNRFDSSLYGSGIVTEQTVGTSANDFAFNICEYGGFDHASGTYIGEDTSDTIVSGAELWGITDSFHHNILRYNAGSGISLGNANSQCKDNECYDNGKYMLQQGGPFNLAGYSSGICLRGDSGTWNPQGSMVAGNKCYDSAGSLGGQSYGIGATGVNLANISVTDNDCVSNRVQNYKLTNVVFRSWRGRRLVGTTTYDMASIGAGAQGSQSVTLAGLTASGWALSAYHSSIAAAKLILNAAYDSPNVSNVYFSNLTGGAIDISSGTLTVFADELPAS